MGIAVICVLSILCVVGVDCIVKSIVKSFIFKMPAPAVNIFTCNNENEIEFTMRSVLENYPDSEIKVYDNNSMDETLDILKKFEKDYENITVVKEGNSASNASADL